MNIPLPRSGGFATSRRPSPKVWFITGFLLLSLLFYSLASFFPGNRLWAFDHLSYAAPAVRLFWFGLGATYLILIGILTSQAIISQRPMLSGGLSLAKLLTTKHGMALLGLLGLILFVSFSVASYFLGDGYMIVNSLQYFLDHPTFRINPEFYIRHALTSLFYILSVYALSLVSDLDIGFYLRTLSYFAGVAFIVLMLRFFREWARDESDLLLGSALLFLSGAVLLFFGYVENYTFAYVATALYLFASLRYLSGTMSLKPAIVTCLLAVAFHLSSALLLPSLAYLFMLGLESRRGRAIIRPAHVWVLVGLSLLGAGVFYFLNGSYKTFDHLLHLVSGPGLSQYTLFSEFHVVDILNEIALVSPLVPLSIVIFLLYRSSGVRPLPTEQATFLSISAVYGLFFLLIANPELGLARDWDAFAIVGIILNCSAMVVVASLAIPVSEKRFIAAAFVGFGMWVLIPWIFVNTGEKESVERYGRILAMDADLIRAKDAAYGYEGLAAYYRDREDKLMELSTLDRMSDYHKRARYFIVLSNIVFEVDDSLVGDSTIAKNLRKMREYSLELQRGGLTQLDSLFLVAYSDLTMLWANRGHIAEAREYVTEVEGRFPSIPRIHAILARMSYLSGDFRGAIKHFGAAVALDSSLVYDDLEFVTTWGLAHRDDGNPRKAAEIYERAVERHPRSYELYLTLGSIYAQDLNDVRKGRAVWRRLVTLAPDSPEGRKAQEELSSSGRRERGSQRVVR